MPFTDAAALSVNDLTAYLMLDVCGILDSQRQVPHIAIYKRVKILAKFYLFQISSPTST